MCRSRKDMDFMLTVPDLTGSLRNMRAIIMGILYNQNNEGFYVGMREQLLDTITCKIHIFEPTLNIVLCFIT
jgi:hypothetical protein